MKLLIIRHGDPDYSIDSLTEKGHREAELLSTRIAPMDIAAYYVSPLGRAQATVEYTLKKCGRTAETLDWLHEFDRNLIIGPDGQRRIASRLCHLCTTKPPRKIIRITVKSAIFS